MADEQPEPAKNLRELIAKEVGMDPAKVDASVAFDFSYDTKGEYKNRPEVTTKDIDNTKNRDTVFKNGNYDARDKPDIMAGAEAFGNELIVIAKKQGVDLAKLPELQGVDYNGDGKLDAKEIGATIVAASMYTVKEGSTIH